MATRKVSLFVRILFAVTLMAALSLSVFNPVFAQTPDPWVPFCSGAGALVLQEESNTGDGVSMSAEDMVANWQCDQKSPLLAYVEPWDGNGNRDKAKFENKFNADAMCIGTPEEILDFATRTGLENGSLWIDIRDYPNHPLVVSCSSVVDADSFGLNPMENQIDLDRMGWVRGRADDLFGVQKYVDAYPEDLLAVRMTQLGWATTTSAAPVDAELPAPASNDAEAPAPASDAPAPAADNARIDDLEAQISELKDLIVAQNQPAPAAPALDGVPTWVPAALATFGALVLALWAFRLIRNSRGIFSTIVGGIIGVGLIIWGAGLGSPWAPWPGWLWVLVGIGIVLYALFDLFRDRITGLFRRRTTPPTP